MKEQDVSIRLFGGFEVHRNGDLVTNFGYDKVRALLAYLLLEPANPHGRDVLAGLFWPEEPESDARQSLRQALFRLRSALKDDARSPPLLLATRTAIQRNPEATVETDVAAFEQYLEAATNSASNEIDSLVQATALYRGELLHGVSLAGTPAFEDWLRRKREHYHQQVVDLLGRIIRQYQQLNDYEPACHYARRLVSLAPWREDAHRQLMLLLARTGRRSAALKQYEVCCRQIRKELDTEPAPATKRVHRRIQEMAFARFELPPQPTPFVGREQELSTLIAYLSDPKCRLITLTGLGGMGKSRLALQAGRRAARQRAHMFLHGVAFVPLVGVDTHEHMTAAIAQALDFTFSAREDPQMQLLTYLQEKELLLILDSFEHLVNDDSLALLSKMVASAPDVTLLVTSRVRLHLPSEHLMPVGGLSVPDVEAASRVLAEPGVEQSGAPHLFMASMQRIQPDVTPTEDDVRDIIRICQMLAGMPLAIELAAAWTDMLSLTDIAARIEQSLDVLRRDRPGSPARHRSVRAVFDGSWRRLGSNEQRVLAELSLFRGGFTRQAAESVTGVTLPLLSRLVGHSLVQYDRARDRYDVHELLRQYSTEKLGERAAESDANVVADVRSRHCDYYCARMQALEADLWSTREDAALKEIDANFENIRSAWYWAIQQRMVHQLNQAATMLHQYLSRRGRYDEGVAAFQAAIGTVRTHSSRDATHVLAKLLAFRGDLLHQRGDVEQARRNLQESLECLERPMLAQQDTRAERAFVLWCLALLTREAEEAEPLLEESLALYRAIGDEPQVATVLAGLGLSRAHLKITRWMTFVSA